MYETVVLCFLAAFELQDKRCSGHCAWFVWHCSSQFVSYSNVFDHCLVFHLLSL